MAKENKSVEIDGHYFESINQAAKAYKISRSQLGRKLTALGSYCVTTAQLQMRLPKPNLEHVSVEPGLSWDFVYRQVATSSSPKNRSVESKVFPHHHAA
jgi:hypothetical protein